MSNYGKVVIYQCKECGHIQRGASESEYLTKPKCLNCGARKLDINKIIKAKKRKGRGVK